MSTLKRFLKLSGALATLAVATVASADPKVPPPSTELPPAASEELPQCLPPCEPEAKPQVIEKEPMSGTLEAPPAPPPAPAPAPKERKHSMVFAPETVSLSTGAGPADYFGSAITAGGSGGTFVGGAWDLRATFGTKSIMAIEASYVGSSNKFAGGGSINSNGIDGAFRLQLPTRVQPYIFSGIGYNHMGSNYDGNQFMNAAIKGSDNQFVVPSGLGLAGYLGKHVVLDARFTHRFLTANDITVFSDNSLHQWMLQGRFGYQF